MKPSTLLLPVLALASSAVAADYNTVVKDVQAIQAALISFNNTLNSYNGRLFPALGLLTSGNKVQSAIEAATKDAKASPAFGEGEGSQAVAVANVNLVQTSYSIFDNLVAKKALLNQNLLLGITARPFVKDSLVKQKKASDELAVAVIDKLAEPFKSLAPTITKQLDQRFDDTIKEFS